MKMGSLMQILQDVMETLPNGRVLDVRIGMHWTAVVVEVDGEKRCGLASTLVPNHLHTGEPDVVEAGDLQRMSGLELANFALSENFPQTSIGMATINALLPKHMKEYRELNAEDVITEHGIGKDVALIGHFPFIQRVRERVGSLTIVEQTPVAGEVHTSQSAEVLSRAGVVAITAMTLVNHTFDHIMEHCSPEAFVLLLGPSTPLSPVLYNYGIHMLSGSVVTNIESVLHTVSQGGTFQQVHRAGVSLVTMITE